MHWEKEIRIRITIRRLFIAVLAASTVANLVIVGAIVEAESSPPAPTATSFVAMISSPARLDTVTVSATLAQSSTVAMAPTSTELPIATPTPLPTFTALADQPFWMVCIKRFYWPTYRVQAGDRLFAIALETRTSVTELIAANCLKSEQVFPGQLLYVPRQIPLAITPTATPTATPTGTLTDTPTATPTGTPTDSPTPSPTSTPTATPTATPTDTATATPTDTATATPSPTNSPTPTSTSTPTPTPVTPSLACNQAEFISDVTIPDGTVVFGGASFTKTWRVKNTGSCTWTQGYALVFWNGEIMGAPEVVRPFANVAPGQMIDVSVRLTAPSAPGIHGGFWRLSDPNGLFFGMGPAGDQPLRVLIDVIEPTPTPTVQSIGCDQAELVADITVPPGTLMALGQKFVKVWQLKNVGTCTWTPSYTIVLTGGTSFGGPGSAPLSGTIAPGQTVEIPFDMIAPLTAGDYHGQWMFKNPNGSLFGIGFKDQPLTVEITVVDVSG